MNVIITLVLLFIALLGLKYNAILLFLASAIAAIIASPRAWMYTTVAAAAMYALMYFHFPSWEAISLVVIAALYAIMTSIEEKKAKQEGQIPPELLAYMLGGGGAAYR
jgi:hypothetical protein